MTFNHVANQMPVRLTFAFLLGMLLVLAATSKAQQLPMSTQLDSLTTDAQVQQFVRSQQLDYKEFTLTDTLSQDCAELQTCMAPGSLTSWFKADFDGNGRTDIVVVGCESEYQQNRVVLCFLNQGNRQFQEVRLSDIFYECAVPQRCFAKSRAAIRYAHIVVKGRGFTKKSLACQVDTLVFDKTQFVEYNHAPKDYHIQKVSFSTTPCYGRCPVLDLQLDQSGAAIYQAKEYSEKPGTFTATIAAAPLQELWTLLNYLDLPKLNDHYAIQVTDNPTCTLSVTYANGQVKTIKDYGEQGTFGLRRAYELLFGLCATQPWK